MNEQGKKKQEGIGGGGAPAKRMPYEAPAVIYEGMLTTRAGSYPDGLMPERGKHGADPDNLFGQ